MDRRRYRPGAIGATTHDAPYIDCMTRLIWPGDQRGGAAAWGVIALNRGETISAAWLILAAVGTYLVGYRFYSRFLANKVFGLDPRRATPAERLNNGRDFVPTTRWVLFGHHFAAIAGAGPLVGPVLAAQFGWLPGTLWIVFGVVLGGAVQDFVILFGSMRRDGKSLGQMAKEEIGPVTGLLAMVAILAIMVILLAVLALVVTNALKDSPWGIFSILCTIPIALGMGIWMRVIRPGKTVEATVAGSSLLAGAGRRAVRRAVAHAGPDVHHGGLTIAWGLMIYGFVASVLPVWLLLAPRDYLSHLHEDRDHRAAGRGDPVVLPPLRCPRSPGSSTAPGRYSPGKLFPFAFITIACGAISGFHALVSSGTTPKMIRRESDARLIGYGGMLTESFVAIMALCAARALDPGVYFSINAPLARAGRNGGERGRADPPVGLRGDAGPAAPPWPRRWARASLLGRAGGAPSLAVGMAQIFSGVFGQA